MKSDTMGHHLTKLVFVISLFLIAMPAWNQNRATSDLRAKSGATAVFVDEKLNYKGVESFSFQLETPELDGRGEPLEQYKFRLLHSLKLLKASGLDIKMLTIKADLNMRSLQKTELEEPIPVIQYLDKTSEYSFIEERWGTELSGEFRKDGFIHDAWELEMLKLLRLKEAILESRLIRERQIDMVINTSAKESGNLQYDISLALPEYILEKTVKETLFAEQLSKELNGLFNQTGFLYFRNVGIHPPQEGNRKLEFYFTNDEISYSRQDREAFAREVQPVIDFLRTQGQLNSVEFRFETNKGPACWRNPSPFAYDGQMLELEYLLNGRRDQLSVEKGPIDVRRQELLNLIVLRRALGINSRDKVKMHLVNDESKIEQQTKVILYLKE